jgi:hypothetical protein
MNDHVMPSGPFHGGESGSIPLGSANNFNGLAPDLAHLGQDAQGFYCGFAGIVLRGSESSNLIHFLDVRVMLQFPRRQ